ncbi:MAG: RecQ family ATP-dependent DNA helicase [Cyclobacteriaceae bacterium]|nr:RecQ family ATP-dependent DNA helicase [Cyclobacteriaceae bacterium]
MTTPELILKKYWGFDSFRPVQKDIINSVLEGNDTLALLPTGGGKSICYQVPGLLKEGICIVISPLIALMNDQVASLKKRGIKAIAIHSALDYREIDNALNSCIYGDIKFLYCSPERVQTELFLERVKEMNVNLLAVDEAHCISQWGHDFRPSYLKINEFRKVLENVNVLGLTATANAKVQTEIQEELGFSEGYLFKSSFVRPNISFSVRMVEDKEAKLLEILSKVNGSAIVYVRSRKGTKELSELLRKNKVSSTFFHAGLQPKVKEQRQQEWINNSIRVIVATNAFGMGIDKSNVRLVVHYEAPSSPEDYYQEAGRAGRDGRLAYAVLLAHKLDFDQMLNQLELNHPPKEFLVQVYQAVANHYQMAVGSGFMSSRVFDLHEFCKKYELDMISTYHAFKRLEEEGLLQLTDSSLKHSRLKISVNNTELYKFQIANVKFDAFIKGVLRIYGGALFTDFLVISEAKIAQFIEVEEKQVGELLDKLDKIGIVSYVRASGKPEIVFLQARVDVSKLFKSSTRLQTLKGHVKQRLDAIIVYLKNDQKCRMQLLLSYFDEEYSSCGKCDICLDKKHNKEIDFYEIILNKVSERSVRQEDLLQEIPSSKKELFLVTIREMLDAGIIKKVDDQFYLYSK